MLANHRSQDFVDASDPRDVARILRNAADAFGPVASELASAHSDPQAGKVWDDFVRILNCAADSCERACAKRRV